MAAPRVVGVSRPRACMYIQGGGCHLVTASPVAERLASRRLWELFKHGETTRRLYLAPPRERRKCEGGKTSRAVGVGVVGVSRPLARATTDETSPPLIRRDAAAAHGMSLRSTNVGVLRRSRGRAVDGIETEDGTGGGDGHGHGDGDGDEEITYGTYCRQQQGKGTSWRRAGQTDLGRAARLRHQRCEGADDDGNARSSDGNGQSVEPNVIGMSVWDAAAVEEPVADVGAGTGGAAGAAAAATASQDASDTPLMGAVRSSRSTNRDRCICLLGRGHVFESTCTRSRNSTVHRCGASSELFAGDDDDSDGSIDGWIVELEREINAQHHALVDLGLLPPPNDIE